MTWNRGDARPRSRLTCSLSNPDVVVPLTMSAYSLLHRNLLDTAITRTERLVLVGRRKALAIAVRTAGTGRGHTALTHRLQDPGATRSRPSTATPTGRHSHHPPRTCPPGSPRPARDHHQPRCVPGTR